MPAEDVPQEFPDVSQKLSAPKKLSAFERDRQAQEEKRKRAEAENAAALKLFEDSFADDDGADNDDFDGFPTFNVPRGSKAGLGGPRIGPASGGPLPPNLKRKRALEELREQQEARKEQQAIADEYTLQGHTSEEQDQYIREHEREDAAPRPTVQLTSLPPATTIEDVKALLRDHLSVHSVQLQAAQTANGKTSLNAIAALSSETPTSQIDNAVSVLKDKYLGLGFHLSISRHLSSTSLIPTLISGPNATSTEPFGARKAVDDQPGRSNLQYAPPPGGFAPPESYEARSRNDGSWTNSNIAVQPPLDTYTVRAIHIMVDRLLSEPDSERALELEAMLMALPEVQADEHFSFLYNSRSPAGVYYRYLLWNDDECIETLQEQKRLARGPERVYEDVVIDWTPPNGDMPFVDLSTLGRALDHPSYESSDDESDDGEGARRFNSSRKERDGPLTPADAKRLHPLQLAKFAWYLSSMPATHAKLRKCDVAAVTSFAINHAGAAAEEIVDMLVLNVEKPFTQTRCANLGMDDIPSDEEDAYEPDEDLPTVDVTSPAAHDNLHADKRDQYDPSQAKLVALYLISDVLHNSSTAGVRNAWKYRSLFEIAFRRQRIFEHLGRLEKDLGWGRIKSEQWRNRIRVLFEIWEAGSVFAGDVFEALKKDFFEQPEGDDQELTIASHEPSLEPKILARFKRIDGTSSPGHTVEEPRTSSVGMETSQTPSGNGVDGVPLPFTELDGMSSFVEEAQDKLNPGEAPSETAAAPSSAYDVDWSAMDVDEAPAAVPAPPAISFKMAGGSSKLAPSEDSKRTKQTEDMFADSDEE
jgi:U2-associated protein SR140